MLTKIEPWDFPVHSAEVDVGLGIQVETGVMRICKPMPAQHSNQLSNLSILV